MKVWYWKFKNNNQDFRKAEHFGYSTDVDEAHLQELVEKDYYSTTRELAKELNNMPINHPMHHKNLMYEFNYGVPDELIQAAKDRCVQSCINLLEY